MATTGPRDTPQRRLRGTLARMLSRSALVAVALASLHGGLGLGQSSTPAPARPGGTPWQQQRDWLLQRNRLLQQRLQLQQRCLQSAGSATALDGCRLEPGMMPYGGAMHGWGGGPWQGCPWW